MLETYTKEEWDSMPLVKKAESKKLAIEMYLRSEMFDEMYVGEGDERKVVAKQSWVVRDNKTFSVEVTDEDYDDLIHKSKTPQAVIRRINKVRDSISTFPKKLG
jgi:formylmethanofuran dehydrogenase subunit A